MADAPTVDEFAESLSEISTEWYTLGIFMGAQPHDLNSIGLRFSSEGAMRCLIELYECLKSKGKTPSWEFLVGSLKRMNKVYSTYLQAVVSIEWRSRKKW